MQNKVDFFFGRMTTWAKVVSSEHAEASSSPASFIAFSLASRFEISILTVYVRKGLICLIDQVSECQILDLSS